MEQEKLAKEKEEQEKRVKEQKLKESFSDANVQWEMDKAQMKDTVVQKPKIAEDSNASPQGAAAKAAGAAKVE